MDRKQFEDFLKNHKAETELMRQQAWALHESVNQHYDKTHPYGYHLSMVAHEVESYGHEMVADEEDILPLIFAAYYHDSIEDARLTYNDVKRAASELSMDGAPVMGPRQALMATEIVYALTNDKGRTREERAGEHYYQGIRETPYAPFVKLCDRSANMTYSFVGTNKENNHMHEVYQQEWPHFIAAITSPSDDPRQALPKSMIESLEKLMGQ